MTEEDIELFHIKLNGIEKQLEEILKMNSKEIEEIRIIVKEEIANYWDEMIKNIELISEPFKELERLVKKLSSG